MRRQILLNEDGTATYERLVPEGTGERILETKRVDAFSLVPEQGEMLTLPPNCRFVRSEEQVTTFVIEEPPAIRTVKWLTENAAYSEMKANLLKSGAHNLWGIEPDKFKELLKYQQEFRLAFPYIIKVFSFIGGSFSKGKLWYRNQPLKNERSELLHANLPNRDADGRMCLTDRVKLGDFGQQNSFAEMISFIESEFWGSAWNQDWTDNFFFMANRHPAVSSPWEWERQSKIDPLFVLKMPWRAVERTVGEEVRTLLNNRTEQLKVFDWFVGKVRTADAWDGAPKKSEGSIKPSPTELLMLGQTTVSIGDELEFLADAFAGCQKGMVRTIEWFSRPTNGSSSRSVKLSGIEAPLPLIVNGRLINSVQSRKIVTEEPITLGGIRIERGTICGFFDWPGREKRFKIVEYVSRGPRGAILVRFDQESFFTAIGEHEVLYKGVVVLPPESNAAPTQVILSDGRVVRHGDKFFLEGDSSTTIVEVGQFKPIVDGEASRFFYSPSGMHALTDTNGRCDSRLHSFIAETNTKFAKLSERIVRASDWVESGGRRYQVQGFSPAFAGNVRYAQVLSTNNTSIWLRCRDLKVLPSITITDGVLKFGNEEFKPGLYSLGASAEPQWVTGFERASPDIVYAVKKDDTRIYFISNWKRVEFNERVDVIHRRKGFQTIRRGMRVRIAEQYVSKEAQLSLPATPITEVSTKFIVSHVRGKFMYFYGGKCLPLTNLVYFEARIRNRWVPIVKGARPPVIESSPKIWDNVPSYLRMHPQFGAVVGRDASGTVIRIGDSVRFNHAKALAPDHIFKVAHFGVGDGSPTTWLYLDAMQDLGQEPRDNVVGLDTLPPRWARDNKWWRSMVWEKTVNCHVVKE